MQVLFDKNRIDMSLKTWYGGANFIDMIIFVVLYHSLY